MEVVLFARRRIDSRHGEQNAKRLEGIGADIVLQPPVFVLAASSTAAMSEKLVELLAGVQGVKAVFAGDGSTEHAGEWD